MTAVARGLPTAARSHPGLWPGRWPAEDAGPKRLASVHGAAELGARAGGGLEVTAVRDTLGTTMVVLRDPGEVFVLRHTLGRRPLEDPSSWWVERIDPLTLELIVRSPDLEGGPFWPGGLAAHANGSLHAVCGNGAFRLSADLELLAETRLPAARPYNSFVVLQDGTLAMKDFDRELREPSSVVLLDPDTLERRCDDVAVGESAIARLSADGDDLYVVGATEVKRFRWGGGVLELDSGWGGEYLVPGNSYGWDPVIGGGQLWFLDNGAHDFVTTMRGAGVAPGPVHLHRYSLADPSDHERVEVCGLTRGAVTDPPLYDEQRRIAVAYDSANGVVQAFRFDGGLEPLWRRELNHSAHMIHFAGSGELVLHDFKGPAFHRSKLGRALGRRYTAPIRHSRLGRLAAPGSRDEVVVVDIETGEEHARAPVPTLMQSVVFPAPGFDRDLYWVTITTVARVAVTGSPPNNGS